MEAPRDNKSSEIWDVLDRCGLAVGVRMDEPLDKHCSVRIGGQARVWAEVGSEAALKATLEAARRLDLEVHVVGLGSNVLFPDAGIDGLVMRLVDDLADWELETLAGEEREGGEGPETMDRAVVCVGAGAVNAHVVRGLLADGWVGAEFLTLIPGTFGGAVAMNAGTKEGELSSILRDAVILRPNEDGSGEFERRRLSGEELGLRYRHSDLPEGAVVVEGRIDVRRGDAEAARQRMRADRERREQTQPYRLASVGSTFANPDEGYAGAMIDEVGLKGHRIGGAKISKEHANFFINDEESSCEDFLKLMALARVRVREKFGVTLRPEVRFVGFDGWADMERFERELC